MGLWVVGSTPVLPKKRASRNWRSFFILLPQNKPTNMKKVLLSLLVTATLLACKDQQTTSATPVPNASGYTLDSSANIDLVKKSNAAGTSGDAATYKSTYADSAVFHDNMNKMTLSQNLEMVDQFKKAGVKFSVEYNALWETIGNKPDEKGVSNYVLAYLTSSFTKGDKTVKIAQFQVDAIKDGKIVEEWIIYDPTELVALLK